MDLPNCMVSVLLDKKHKVIRADKQKYMEDLATTEEKAPSEGNMKHIYDIMKKLARKYGKSE